jgi:hypothetical protein
MGVCAARLEPAATWFETTDVIENMVTRIERILLIMAVLEVGRGGRLMSRAPGWLGGAQPRGGAHFRG